VHGQRAGRAARKAQRLDDVGVRAEGKALAGGKGDDGGVGQRGAGGSGVAGGGIGGLGRRSEGGEEHRVEQRGRGLAARAVGQGDDLVAQPRPPTTEGLDAREDRRLAVAVAAAVAVAGAGGLVRGRVGHAGRTTAVSFKWRWTAAHTANINASWVSWIRCTLSERTTRQ
jgi:hypothetical protein